MCRHTPLPAAVLSAFSFTHRILLQRSKRGVRGQGGVLYLLLSSEWSIGQGKQGALSGHPALDLHSASTQKRLETNLEGCSLPFLMLPPQLCWPLTSGIPSCGGMVLPRCSTLLFLHRWWCDLSPALLPPPPCLSPCFPANSVCHVQLKYFGAQLHSETCWAGGRGRWREGHVSLLKGATVPGCCWPHGEHALSELATLLTCLLPEILGFSTVLLDIALNLSHKGHIFFWKVLKSVVFFDEY